MRLPAVQRTDERYKTEDGKVLPEHGERGETQSLNPPRRLAASVIRCSPSMQEYRA